MDNVHILNANVNIDSMDKIIVLLTPHKTPWRHLKDSEIYCKVNFLCRKIKSRAGFKECTKYLAT